MQLTKEEIKNCLLSNLHLDLLKDEFLGILGIHNDENGKNLHHKMDYDIFSISLKFLNFLPFSVFKNF